MVDDDVRALFVQKFSIDQYYSSFGIMERNGIICIAHMRNMNKKKCLSWIINCVQFKRFIDKNKYENKNDDIRCIVLY